MARFKNYLLVVVGLGLAGAIGAAFGTGSAQAVVSTLVSVVNPTTSPVPTSVVNSNLNPVPTSSVNVTDPGRIAYQSSVSHIGNCSGSACQFFFPTVPAGHRVVVQHVAGQVQFNAVPNSILVDITCCGSLVSEFIAAPIYPGPSGFDQPVLFYVDSSNSAIVEILLTGAVFAGNSFVTLTGYELDCTAAACAPIATQ